MIIDKSCVDLMNFSRGISKLAHVAVFAVGFCAYAAIAVSAETRANPSTTVQMDLEKLRSAAFKRCQSKFREPIRKSVPALDPPRGGTPLEEGLVYQEELAIRTTSILDRHGFYVSPRPRAAVNWLPMKVFVETETPSVFKEKTWDDARPDFSSAEIRPPIDVSQLPTEGRQLTEVIVGHQSPTGDFPQLFDIRSSAYVRFAGYSPQITGASLRLGADGVFGRAADLFSKGEDFPMIREIYISTVNHSTAKAFVITENKMFCAAMELQLNEGSQTSITVDGYWYTRENFEWRKNQNTGLVAYSSMMFKNENDTPERDSDEAHDSDQLRVRYQSGPEILHLISVPKSGLKMSDYSKPRAESRVVAWRLENADRDPKHYADFLSALGSTNYDKRASYDVEILESTIRTGLRFYEHSPDGEYGDNIVALSTIREDIKKAKSAADFVRFRYRTTSYYP